MSVPIDKSWITLEFRDRRFVDGLASFLEFANKPYIPCPCAKCRNAGYSQTQETVKQHCYKNGFYSKYVKWIHHGEDAGPVSEGVEHAREKTRSECEQSQHTNDDFIMNEGVGVAWNTVVEELGDDDNHMDAILEEDHGAVGQDGPANADVDPTNFAENLNAAMCMLYPGCEQFSVLRFVLKLFKLKVRYGWSDVSFTDLLQLLKMVLPRDNKTPDSTYQAEKIVKELGLTYKKIDACPNDCMLYWGEDKEHLISCPTCGASRYKLRTIEERKNRVDAAAKQLRYFPITERLKRMYSVEWVAKEMTWHSRNKLEDGVLGHPVDSASWERFDFLYPDYALEKRNVRLGLATDGFNPFGLKSSSYSSWPVMCVTYNLPPWLCMKPQFIMLVLLIPGPRQPGKDIDVYLRPFVDELKSLWNVGCVVKDSSTGIPFIMRANLMWTMHDLPAYGNISGCRTKGKYACPVCGPNTSTLRLKFGKKNVYMCHRCFLAMTDPRRMDVRECSFDMTEEHRPQPLRLTGDEVIEMTKHLNMKWGKCNQRTDCEDGEDDSTCDGFFKQSILYELPYFKDLPIRHNLDVMHVEKNVCEILVALMLDIKTKTKDNDNARKDLELLGIKKDYWLNAAEKKKLRGPLCLRGDEKKLFFETLKDISVPVGFSSNWNNIVKAKGSSYELHAMKSHDYHILMQHLLPVLIQHAYKDRPESKRVILSFSTFFRALCSRRIDVSALHILERGMAQTLCDLEKMCPPSLFVLMMHLPVHLAYEARVMGPVFYRWMYVFERLMKTYKDYVTNKARPEGCIAERYLKEETMIFCDGYKGGGSILEKLEQNIEGLDVTAADDFTTDIEEAGLVGGGTSYYLEGVEYEQVRFWILKSHPCYEDWYKRYNSYLEMCRRERGRRAYYRIGADDEFIPWLKRQPDFINSDDSDFQDVVRGPTCYSTRYNKYAVNGYLYITKDKERGRRNQNSGVSTKCSTTFRSSVKDKNPIDMPTDYYGVLRMIIQLEYRNGYKPVVFKCDWAKVPHGVKMDTETNLLMVNLSNIVSSSQMNDEPFILAEHVSQVFYSKDPLNPDWSVAVEVPRKVYSDLNSSGTIVEETTVDASYARPRTSRPFTEDELIFNDPTDLVDTDVVDVGTSKRRNKRRKRN